MQSIKWMSESLITVLVELISFINSTPKSYLEGCPTQKIESIEDIDAFFTAVSSSPSITAICVVVVRASSCKIFTI